MGSLELRKIHEGKRGEIHIITGDSLKDEEITIFITKRKFARGGCIHKENDEHCVVLEGYVECFLKDRKAEILRKGQTFKIPKNTPHYFVSLSDSIVMEFGATPEEKKEKHPEFRKIVDEINKDAD